jgi:hypothetical protein
MANEDGIPGECNTDSKRPSCGEYLSPQSGVVITRPQNYKCAKPRDRIRPSHNLFTSLNLEPTKILNHTVTIMSQPDYEIYKLGDWELQSGERLADAHIAYKTFGDPKLPAIVYPTWFSGGMLLSIELFFH